MWIPCDLPAGGCVPGVSSGIGDHFAGRAEEGPREHLVVYLGGAASVPRDAEGFLDTAVGVGFDTIGLRYDTDDGLTVTAPCKRLMLEADAQACFREVRERTTFGVHDLAAWPTLDEVGPTDTVEARLSSLLDHLVATDPGGRWSSYRDAAGAPDWSRVILVGWSFGAGIAAHVAGQREVRAVVMIDGVKDPYDLGPGPFRAPLAPGLTPGCRFWGLYDHNQVEATLLLEQWSGLGMLETPGGAAGESVDGSATSTAGIVGVGERRFSTGNTCCSAPGVRCEARTAHSTFTVRADTFADISRCEKLAPDEDEYHLRALLEDLLLAADAETCAAP